MGLSDPWVDSLDIIAFQRVKKLLGINQKGISVPWSNSIGIIALHTTKTIYKD